MKALDESNDGVHVVVEQRNMEVERLSIEERRHAAHLTRFIS